VEYILHVLWFFLSVLPFISINRHQENIVSVENTREKEWVSLSACNLLVIFEIITVCFISSEYSKPPPVDFPSNNNDMNPKISDFGLARMFVPGQTEGETSKVIGT